MVCKAATREDGKDEQGVRTYIVSRKPFAAMSHASSGGQMRWAYWRRVHEMASQRQDSISSHTVERSSCHPGVCRTDGSAE